MSEKNSRSANGGNFKKDAIKGKDGATANNSYNIVINSTGSTKGQIINSAKSRAKDKNQDYRKAAGSKYRFRWLINFKHSDIFISSDDDIGDKILNPLKEIYSLLESFISKTPFFLKSLVPISPHATYPEVINNMCRLSQEFNVGPMAAVAGAVNDYLAESLLFSKNLFIENG
ncbi:MAG: hypothetical protein JW997_06900, partial [Actinobacteria bacterium]|nr:hypothetical protein [Actinomycetota bacterium]